MKKTYLKIIAICLVLVLVSSLIACNIFEPNGPTKTPTTTPKPTPRDYVGKIVFSTFKKANDSDSADAFGRDFTMLYPNVEVEVDYAESEEAYFASLDERINNGTIGDIFVIDDSRIAKYAKEEKIVDFTPYLENLIEYETFTRLRPDRILFDVAYKASTYKGNMYMVATDYNHQFVFLNYNFLNEADLDVPKDKWTFDDFIYYAESLKDITGIRVPVIMDYTDEAIWSAFARGYVNMGQDKEEDKTDKKDAVELTDSILFDVNPLDKIQTLNLTRPEVLYGLSKLADFVKSGLVEKNSLTVDDLREVGMVVMDKVQFNRIAEDLKNVSFDWDLIHFPSFEERNVGTYVYGLAVSSKTLETSQEQMDMSVQLALQTLIEDSALIYGGLGESVPANMAVNDMKFWREYPVRGKNTSVFSTYSEDDFPAIITYKMNIEAANEYYKVSEALESFILEGTDLEAALAEIENKVNSLWEQEPQYEETPKPKETENVTETPSPENTPAST